MLEEDEWNQAAYFRVPEEHLYAILRTATDPVAHALMVRPFASERHKPYIPWVRWGRRGRAAVGGQTKEWLNERFPLSEDRASAMNIPL